MQICDRCYSPIESGSVCENCGNGRELDLDPRPSKSRGLRVALIGTGSTLLVVAISIGVFLMGPSPSELSGQPQEESFELQPDESHSHDEVTDGDNSEGFSFIFQGRDRETMPRWNPCVDQDYAINPGGFSLGDDYLLEQAFAETFELSGLKFSYIGDTEDNHTKQSGEYETPNGAAEVIVEYLDEQEYRVAASEVGLASSIAFAGPVARGIVGETGYLVSGRIVINAKEIADLLEAGREEVVANAYLHEIGHLIGLGHVENPDALMYGGSSYFSNLTEGDRLGFVWAGDGPCTD